MAEKRLIDANALVGRIKERLKNDMIVRWLSGIVEDAPTVDAVEVVRCWECKHYDFGVCLKICSDGAVSQYAWHARNEDDFCSYGERKDGDGNG